VCELVSVGDSKPCVLSLTDSDIIRCLRSEVQRLHGDYGLAVVHLSLRGYTSAHLRILHIEFTVKREDDVKAQCNHCRLKITEK